MSYDQEPDHLPRKLAANRRHLVMKRGYCMGQLLIEGGDCSITCIFLFSNSHFFWNIIQVKFSLKLHSAYIAIGAVHLLVIKRVKHWHISASMQKVNRATLALSLMIFLLICHVIFHVGRTGVFVSLYTQQNVNAKYIRKSF